MNDHIDGHGVRSRLAALGLAALLGALLWHFTSAGLSAAMTTRRLAIPVEIGLAVEILINGIDPVDLSGIRMDTGDLNGDGSADLVIGARQADPGGREDAGETYILFGPLAPGVIELDTDADVTLHGIDAGDHSGISVAIGDLNQDGRNDLVIGARRADPSGREDAGEAYVIFGPIAAGTFGLADRASVFVHGIDPFDETGVGAAVGDVNGDQLPDLVVGARQADPGGRQDAGETYVVFGPIVTGTLELSTTADITLNGVAIGDLSGYGLDVGDLNGDATNDLVIGAWAAEGGGLLDAGEVYVLFGPLADPVYELASDSDLVIQGAAAEDHLGVGAAIADVNLDGQPDIMLGATTADPPGRLDAGIAYVAYGPFAAGVYSISDLSDLVVYGVDDSDFFGIGVEAGDITGDGVPELIFGAFRADPHGKFNAGQTYVILGRQADLALAVAHANAPGNAPETQVFHLGITNLGPGPAINTLARQSLPATSLFQSASSPACAYEPVVHQVTCAVGALDAGAALSVAITVTAPAMSPLDSVVEVASRSGDPILENNRVAHAAIMPPTCAGRAATLFGTDQDDVLVGTPGEDVIHGLSGNDILIGLLANDRLCGGPGNDLLRGDEGDDRVFGGTGNDRLIGGSGNDALLGGGGHDVHLGDAGSDAFVCGPGQDYAHGGADPDVAAADCEIQIDIES